MTIIAYSYDLTGFMLIGRKVGQVRINGENGSKYTDIIKTRSDRNGRNGFNYTRQKIQPRNRLV